MGLPAWWNDQGREQNRRSREQERRRAAHVGGRTRPGSGSSWRARGDVRSKEDLEQIKYTDKDVFPLDVREWARIRRDAFDAGREPNLVIDFTTHHTRLVIHEEPL